MPAATIWPKKNETLNRDVRTGRSLGYASSPIREDPETMQVGIPNPKIILATIYIATTICCKKGMSAFVSAVSYTNFLH